jgi:hypothetical protein
MPAQLTQNSDPDLITKVAIVEDNATLRKYLAEFAPAHPPRKPLSKFRRTNQTSF